MIDGMTLLFVVALLSLWRFVHYYRKGNIKFAVLFMFVFAFTVGRIYTYFEIAINDYLQELERYEKKYNRNPDCPLITRVLRNSKTSIVLSRGRDIPRSDQSGDYHDVHQGPSCTI